MTRRNMFVACAVGAVVLIGVIWWASVAWVHAPAAALQLRIDKVSASLDGRRRDLDRARSVAEAIDAITSRTLGSTTEAMDLALRSRLGELAEAAGVQDVRVGTSPPVVEGTPGKRSFKSRSVRELRDEPDFLLVPASITAKGTWAQVSLLVESIQAESWPHRVTRVRLVGRDDGATVEATVQLEALFVPGAGPGESADLATPLATVDVLDVPNPFAVPTPPTPPTPPPSPESTTKPPSGWRVVHIGHVQGDREVLLRSSKGNRRRMVVGDALNGITLVSIEPDGDGIDVATFARDGAEWVVGAGQPMQRP